MGAIKSSARFFGYPPDHPLLSSIEKRRFTDAFMFFTLQPSLLSGMYLSNLNFCCLFLLFFVTRIFLSFARQFIFFFFPDSSRVFFWDAMEFGGALLSCDYLPCTFASTYCVAFHLIFLTHFVPASNYPSSQLYSFHIPSTFLES